jgi:MinD-like ATPase involved in chromosome partitioning or flagellar assembly
VFAARRQDHVLAADADPDHGSLAWRLGLPEREPLAALAPRLLAARGIGELDPLLAGTPVGVRMLPGAGAPPAMTRDVTRALSRFFAICVTDCGRGLDAPGTTEVLGEAHSAVLVAPATPDGVRSTRAGLARIPPGLLPRVAVVLNTADRGGRAALDLGAARSALAGTGAPVVVLPYDRHLAAGTPIVPKRLAEATTVEATRLAGYALRCAGGGPGGPP